MSHFTELLDCRPDQGIIRLHEQRLVVLSAAAMGLLRKALIDTVGFAEGGSRGVPQVAVIGSPITTLSGRRPAALRPRANTMSQAIVASVERSQIMRWQNLWGSAAFAIVFFGTGLLLGSYRRTAEPIHSTVEERLRPAATLPGEPATGSTIYVPVYSTLFLGLANRANTVDLTATVSVRNLSATHPITLDWVRYYDSVGKHIRDYLDKPSTLPAMGSVEFVVQRSDSTGGPGANFLIRWHAAATVDEPLVEAIMLGQSGNAGISFTSRGRAVIPAAER